MYGCKTRTKCPMLHAKQVALYSIGFSGVSSPPSPATFRPGSPSLPLPQAVFFSFSPFSYPARDAGSRLLKVILLVLGWVAGEFSGSREHFIGCRTPASDRLHEPPCIPSCICRLSHQADPANSRCSRRAWWPNRQTETSAPQTGGETDSNPWQTGRMFTSK
jgi:hypothetical protein